MAGRWELTEEQWELVSPVLAPVRRADNRGRPWQDTCAVLHGVLWVLGRARTDPSCRRNIRRTRPAIGAFSSGCAMAVSWRRGAFWHSTCVSAASSIWMRRSSVLPSQARKKGLCGRPHAARQGHQDRRYRLWRWSSSRRYCRQRFACRVPACGVCSGRMLLRPAPGAAHRRQGLRLGPARPHARPRLRHRADCAQPP